MLMKKHLFLLIALLVNLNINAQDNLFANMQAMPRVNDTLMVGEGYRILIKDLKGIKSKDIYKKITTESIWVSIGYSWQQIYEDKFEKIDNLYIYTRDYNPKNNITNKYILYQRAYIYNMGDEHLRVISFTRQGYPRNTNSDTDNLKYRKVFEQQLATNICYYGVPQSVIVQNTDSSVYFFGQEIEIPRLPKPKEYDPDADGYYVMYEPKNIVSDYTKMRGVYNQDQVRWDSFTWPEDRDEQLKISIDKLKKHATYNRVTEAKDTILFMGKKLVADRVNIQHSGYQGPVINTNYLISDELNGKPILLEINYMEDSIRTRNGLPPFINDNFVKRLSVSDSTGFIIRPDSIPVEDTIFVAKKTRMPIWSYHDKHTRINGISVGFGSIDNFYKPLNVTTNGLRLEVPGSGILGIFAAPYFLMPISNTMDSASLLRANKEKIEFEIKNKNRAERVNGISVSLTGSFGDFCQLINGIQIGGIINSPYKTNGISIGGIMNSSYRTNGISIGGIHNIQVINNGISIGGLWTNSWQSNGIQISVAWNKAQYLNGLQIGGYNQAYEVRGLQIGIYNNAKILKGLQIGIWNKNGKRSLPLINWGF
jgi:hypothetical protein